MTEKSVTKVYRRSELTAVGITYRDGKGWPINLTHTEYDTLGRPQTIFITIMTRLPESEDA